MLAPGGYHLEAEKANFESLVLSDLHISVTETLRVQLHLNLRTHFETVNVSANSAMVHTDSSALGRVFDKASISDLPLSTRNFTQITGLSPGVTVAVYNAGELGTGATALSQIGRSNDGIYIHGSRRTTTIGNSTASASAMSRVPVRLAEVFLFPIPMRSKSLRCKPDSMMQASDVRPELT